MIDELIIDKVRDAANIVDVVSDFTQLWRKGRDYQGYCPFHDDRHLGSFVVSESKQICTCFSCQKTYNPISFVMEAEHLSFPDAIRWLGKKYGIVIDEEQKKFKPKPSQPKKYIPIQENLPKRYWPIWMVEQKLNTDSDLLVSWIYSQAWTHEQRERIKEILDYYLVGHSVIRTKRDGIEKRHDFTLFWQIDEKARVHNGHLMKYDYNGSRVKDENEYKQDWVHSRMRYAEKNPFNDRAESASYCLFGQHLLSIPGTENATINIVESEKTALLCAIAWGHFERHIWMACAGIQNLTNKNDMLRPLIKQKRHIVLYPDRDGIEAWQEVKKKIGYEHLTVNTDYVDKYWLPEYDKEKADVADVILRMLRHPDTRLRERPLSQPEVLRDLMSRNPIVQTLIKKLDLVE